MIFTGLSLAQVLTVLGVVGAGVVVLYLLKLRRRRVDVPFVKLWEEILAEKQTTRLFSQLKRWISLLVALLIVAALAFALGDPRKAGATREGRSLVVLVDASASMQATDVEGSRFEGAREALRELIAELGPSDRMLVAQLDASATPLSPLTGDTRVLEEAAEALDVLDVAANPRAGLRLALDVLREQPQAEVVLLSDGLLDQERFDTAAFSERLGESAIAFSWKKLGDEEGNVGIGAFSVRRYPLDKSQSEVLVELYNPTSADRAVELELLGDGESVDVQRLTVHGGERLRRFFRNISGVDQTLEARLRPTGDERDYLPADDRAWARLPERRRARVAVYSAGNLYLQAALLLDEYLEVVEATPDQFPLEGRFDVAIFDSFVPPSPPQTPALYLFPEPAGDQDWMPLAVDGEMESPYFDRIERRHPLMQWTAMGDVNVANALRVELQPGDRAVASDTRGPLIVTGTRHDQPFVAFTFDVRRSDLPLRVAWPLLLLNTIDLFVQERDGFVSSYETGETWYVPVSGGGPGGDHRRPRGNRAGSSGRRGTSRLCRRPGRYVHPPGRRRRRKGLLRRQPRPRRREHHRPARFDHPRRRGGRGAERGSAGSSARDLDLPRPLRAGHPAGRVVQLPPKDDRMRRHLPWLFVTLGLSAAIGWALWSLAVRDGLAFTGGESEVELLHPEWLYLATLAPILGFVARFSLADLPRAQRWLGVALRGALVVALAVALARPARTTDATRISTVFLVDVSESVTDESLATAAAAVAAAREAMRDEDDVQLVTFAREARSVPLAPGADEPLAPIGRHGGGDEGRGSNLQLALQHAYGLFPPGHLRRVVILSDGGQTEGDLLAEASRAAEFGVQVNVRPYREGAPAEVAVRELVLPDRIRVGEPFPVRVRLFASAVTPARLRLYQGETLNGLDGLRDLEVPAGESEVELRSIVHVAGPVTYRVELEPGGGVDGEGAPAAAARGSDRFAENNRYETSVVVPGKPSVLYVEGAEGRARYLAQALGAADFDVDVRSARGIPTSVRELERFDFFVLSDVAADQVTLGQQDAIERYVRDLGGGFMMAGGERGFGLGGWQGTRMERLLPVRMDSERRRDQPSLGLALVIDRSGSMNGQKIELAKEAAKATAELLSSDDYISIIGFDSQPERVVRMQSARNRLRILRDIGRLAARGGTAIFPALDMAYQDLSVTRARIKHVILLTDGQAPERGITELVQVMRAEGITVSTVGLGADVNRALLQSIASLGGGRSYLTNDPHNVPRIFMRETTTVARSSAVEEYFTPSLVQRADFLRGVPIENAPFLHGYVATRAKPSPAQVILQSDLAEPILARWRVGLGWSLAWTSDVKNRWAVEWLRWPAYSRFFAQLVREHMRQRRRQRLDMTAEKVGDEVRVVVDAIGGDDAFMNDLDSSLRIEGPMGAQRAEEGNDDPQLRRTRELDLRQTAPGRYEARFPLDAYGSFVLTATHRREGRPVAESAAQLANPYPAEYRTLEPDVELLQRAAEATGGQTDPEPAALFDRGDDTIRAHEDLWPWLLYLALGLFLLDLLLRRVRLFDRDFRRS